MNKTYSDMMGEYQYVRDAARCHSAWTNLDKFVEELIKQIAPKVERPTSKFQTDVGYDDMGTPVHKD